MIVALLNQKGGVGKTTLALHLAGALASRLETVLLIDADPQSSALDWADQRTLASHRERFGLVSLPRENIHREIGGLARGFDHVVIDGPPRVTGIARSALLAAELVLIPVQPSPLDGWASAEIVRLIEEARLYRPDLAARFVLNRCTPRTIALRQAESGLADSDPPLMRSRIGQRTAFADAIRSGLLVEEYAPASPAAQEIAALADELVRLAGDRR